MGPKGALESKMEVREGMSSVVLTLGPGHTLREAARQMTDKAVGAAVIVDEEAPGPGIISERDVLISIGKGQDPDQECVADHMSASVITASPDWSLERAAAEMAGRNIRHLVIVDGGELAGVLSMRDIMRVWTSDGATSAMTPG
jgi:CBS domain-containing protein